MPSQCDPQRSAASISHSIKPLAGTKTDRLDNVAPIVVGGGTAALPNGARVELELIDERRFASGFVYLRYARRR